MNNQTNPTNEAQPPKVKGERGSALILTLALMSMVIVFFISFSLIAIYNQKNARLSEALMQARLHCQTGLQLFYADMSVQWQEPTAKNRFPGSDETQVNYYNPPSGHDWHGRRFWASSPNNGDTSGIPEAFHIRMGGIDYTPGPDSTFLDAGIGWHHIFSTTGTGAITARIAYLVVDESGKIDPSGVIDSSVAEGNEVRMGNSAEDINIKNLFSVSGLGEQFQTVGIGDGKLNANARWFSYYHIFKASPLARANPDVILKGTVFPFSRDIDGFNANAVNASSQLQPTAKHRFDLKADWDSFNNSIAASNIDTVATPIYTSAGTIDTANVGGIPWLHHCTDTNLKNQIIANLIDYCDSDHFPTTDDAANPTYVGLEKVPYINEIVIRAKILGNSHTRRLQLSVYPELLNPYDEALDASLFPCQLEVMVQPSASGGLTGTSAELFTFTINSALSAHEYRTPSAVRKDVWGMSNKTITDLKVSLAYARVIKDGKLLDFAFGSGTSTPITTTFTKGTLQYITVQADDPRANLDEQNWQWDPEWVASPNQTLGSTNDFCLPNVGGDGVDAETAADPWDVSTMYIRNGPMKTLWELGAIHRGKKWQTLRLTKYKADATETTGLGDYADGDANILDQVKITATGSDDENIIVNGRVSVNSYHKQVLQAVLADLPIGCTYADPANAANKITLTEAGTIVQSGSSPVDGEWLFFNGAESNGSPFAGRGQIANITKLKDGTVYTPHSLAQDNDAAQEEIIGKTAGILTARPNFFTVMVIAQVIRDLPDGVKGGTRGTFDAGVDEIAAEQVMLATLRRDSFTNQFKIIRLEYLEE